MGGKSYGAAVNSLTGKLPKELSYVGISPGGGRTSVREGIIWGESSGGSSWGWGGGIICKPFGLTAASTLSFPQGAP